MRSEQTFLVRTIGQLISGSDYCYFVSYSGISVKDFSEFRNRLAKEGAVCHVLKNSLICKAAAELGIAGIETAGLKGGTAMVCGKGDCGVVAKIVKEFGKEVDKVKAKGGYLDGEVLAASDVENLAGLPSKQVLQAMLLGVLQGPARGLVTVLNAKASSIVNVVNAYKEKQEKQQ
ncbi:MAG: 50S ribosomal protein L10 [Victivallaceae bacterium]|nr:50S ribosomal protein L10 [Victivallaceae bacterium]